MKNGFIILLAVALVGVGIWGYNQYEQNEQHMTYLENQFHRMFYDMVADVQNIQVNLAKTMVTGTPKQNVLLFTETMRLSYDAQEKLSQLPIEHAHVSKTRKFLSQVGDMSLALARKNLEGNPLNTEEMSTLQELHNYANLLSQSLIELQGNIANDGIRIGELQRKATAKLDKVNENMITTRFVDMEERMKEYPELIYDGPFSEHKSRQKPKLEGQEIKPDAIKNIAEKFAGNGVQYEATILGDMNNSTIPAYVIDLQPTNDRNQSNLSMSISKVGGKVLWMLDTRNVEKARLSEKQGVEIAQQFLQKRGFPNMIPTYSIKTDGQMVINFAYQQEDIVVYPDLIKVKVGLDRGDVIGYEAEGFWFNHHERTFETPGVSPSEARERISVQAEAEEPRLVIVPTEGGSEVLCYEFKVDYLEDTFLIYINAQTGEEQKILQVIIKDEGVLMM
ncbi:germination protein YpeB [Geosporobacter ferrireducens]|uniref:Germination protein YpeB n=1 Tax=Geosporobacter ferrireducens TaxID=1424294 RepID=A0A1D8GDC9_9FIRM|nr:germination protein YpeB [Geosporobacter ferrireducens]AOT68907.1 germination protein YpeB [Geosporobacter ferrireducens]MTI54856.1 germination protein YpeB [Geosporobacter ferrireducens]